MSQDPKGAMSVVGVGAAACAACCAVPIMGVVAAAGAATVVAYAAVGAIALAITVPVLILAVRKLRSPTTCSASSGPEPVDLVRPSHRPPKARAGPLPNQ